MNEKGENFEAKYGVLTSELEELRQMIIGYEVKEVTMDSTSIYWHPVWRVFEGVGELRLAFGKLIDALKAVWDAGVAESGKRSICKEKTSYAYLHAAGRRFGPEGAGNGTGDVRQRGNRLAECGIVLCGEYLSTCRRVLECFPQGRLAGPHDDAGLRGTGVGGRPEAGGPGRRAVAGMPVAWRSKDC